MRTWIPLIGLVSGCTVFGSPPDQKTAMFDAMWTDFDEHYGLFEVKPGVDWDALRESVGDRVRDDMDDGAFFDVLSDLLAPLNDGHVWLYAEEIGEFSSLTPLREELFVDLNLLESVVMGYTDASSRVSYGTLTDRVGYVRIHHFSGGNHTRDLREALTSMPDHDSVVIDIRDTPGGRDAISAALAGCFVTEETPFLRARLRNGPERGDFSDPIDYSVKPDPNFLWDRPALLLVDSGTVSAGETFSLAMRQAPRVRLVGEPTTGAFSDVVGRDLPNGWSYSVSIGDWRTHDDVSFEGVGVPVEEPAITSRETYLEGRDQALEEAIVIAERDLEMR